MASTSLTARRTTMALLSQATVLGSGLAALWVTFGVNVLLGGALIQYGIIPRTTVGLRGIVFAPFLHASYHHLAANTVPFLILGWLVMLRDPRHFGRVTLAAMVGSGLMAWTFGASGSVHIGASGVIFGYLGFLILAGWYARSFGAIALSVIVTALWGGVVFGVLPNQPGISWQAHLGGFLAGIWAARRFR